MKNFKKKPASNDFFQCVGLDYHSPNTRPNQTTKLSVYIRLAKSFKAFRTRMHSNALALDIGQRWRMKRRWLTAGILDDMISVQFIPVTDEQPNISAIILNESYSQTNKTFVLLNGKIMTYQPSMEGQFSGWCC